MEVAPAEDAVAKPVVLGKAVGQTVLVSLRDLPAEVAQQLRFLDANQDGTIDFDELLKFSDAGRRAVLKHRKYRRLFIGLAVAVLLQILAFFGVMIGVVELTRQSVVTNQVMVVKGTNTPIQLASSDFYVDGDGVLRMRVANATNATAAGRRLLSTGTPPPLATTSSQFCISANGQYKQPPCAASGSAGASGRKLLQTGGQASAYVQPFTDPDTGLPIPSMLAASPPLCDWSSPDFKLQTGSCSAAHRLNPAGTTVITLPLIFGLEGESAQPLYATSAAYFSNSRSLSCQGGQAYVYTFSATSYIVLCMHASLTADFTTDAPEFGTTAFIDYANFSPPGGFSVPCTTVTGVITTSGAAMPPLCLYPASFAARAINASRVYDPNAAAAVSVHRKLLAADGATSRGLLARATSPPPGTVSSPGPPPILTQACADSCCNSGCICAGGGTCSTASASPSNP